MVVYSIIFTCIMVLGVKIATQEKMVLEGVKESLKKRLGVYAEPIILCEWCMPSLWSFVGWIFAYLYAAISGQHLEFSWLLFYPITVCASSIISGSSWLIIQILVLIYKHNKGE